MSLQPSRVENTDIFSGGEKKFDYYLHSHMYVFIDKVAVEVVSYGSHRRK